MVNATIVPCCDTAYCDDCIRDHLLDLDIEKTVCPACGSKEIKPDHLVPNSCLRSKCDQFGLPT